MFGLACHKMVHAFRRRLWSVHSQAFHSDFDARGQFSPSNRCLGGSFLTAACSQSWLLQVRRTSVFSKRRNQESVLTADRNTEQSWFGKLLLRPGKGCKEAGCVGRAGGE